ncbi:MAG: AraC family transcriptional regulator [Clostridia bacterium]|nr:AraC family transcriptional regulator [Clostridia bacterium]
MSQAPFLYEKRTTDLAFRNFNHNNKKTYLRCSPHLHREIELVCFFEGRAVAYADSQRCELEPGDVFVAFPNQIHSYESFGPEDYYLFIVNPELMPELLDFFQLGIPHSPVIKGAVNDPRIRQTVEALYSACERENEPFGASMRQGYLLALFSELLSRMPLSRLHLGDSNALRAIVSFCTQNFTENLSLSLLEERLHLNKYYISHLFSGKLGLRFNDYINSLRVSEACRYLLNTDQSITDISEKVGFNTLRTFNRAFIKQIGVPPTEYRKNDLRNQK